MRASLGIGDDEPLIIYAGRLDSEKRAEVVVEAFLRLPEAMRAFLVLIGDGPMRAPLAEQLAGTRALLPASSTTAPSCAHGWRAPTSTRRAWPMRRSAFR